MRQNIPVINNVDNVSKATGGRLFAQALMFLTIFTLTFYFPRMANASCEGVLPSLLLNAWVDSKSDGFIKEVGWEYESRFILSLGEEEIHIFTLEDRLLGEPITLSWPNDDDERLPEFVHNLRIHVTGLGHMARRKSEAKLRRVNITREHSYSHLLEVLRDIMAKESKFQLLKEQGSCSYTGGYSFGNVVIIQDESEYGVFTASIPQDERSSTHIEQTRCFGDEYQNDILLATRWVWQCQGEGDIVILVKNVSRFKL